MPPCSDEKIYANLRVYFISDSLWHAIHMLPNETAQAAEDVRARVLLPAHGGKFALALHTWQEPYRELLKESAGRPYRMVMPRIGEAVDMENPADFPHWWEGMA